MMLKLSRRGALLIALVCALSASGYAQTPYSKLYVFGDSLTDSGNALFFTTRVLPQAPDIPAPPYFQGRFSNGFNFADDLSLRLFQQPAVAAFAGGTNFAVGGATTGTANNAAPVPSGLLVQKDTFLQQLNGSGADPKALYLVYGGSNDLFAAIDDVERNPANKDAIEASAIRDAMMNLGEIIGDLSARGARHFLVPNIADLGKLPSFLDGPLSSFASQASVDFDHSLALLLRGFPGLDIRTLDVKVAFDAARGGVGSFADTRTACYTGGIEGGVPPEPCSNPDDHLFWDDIHPSARAHSLLADLAYATVVPEPGARMLLLAGTVLVWIGVRRRRVNSSVS